MISIPVTYISLPHVQGLTIKQAWGSCRGCPVHPETKSKNRMFSLMHSLYILIYRYMTYTQSKKGVITITYLRKTAKQLMSIKRVKDKADVIAD